MREVRGEEEDGCGGSRDGGQGAGDKNEVKILNEVMGGRGAAIDGDDVMCRLINVRGNSIGTDQTDRTGPDRTRHTLILLEY